MGGGRGLVGRMGGGYSFVASLSHVTIEYASLSRRRRVGGKGV